MFVAAPLPPGIGLIRLRAKLCGELKDERHEHERRTAECRGIHEPVHIGQMGPLALRTTIDAIGR